jgi:hypothetical protein
MIGLNTTYTNNSDNYVTTTFFHNLDSCIYSTGILIASNNILFYFRSTSDLVILLWLAKETEPMTKD